MSMLHYAAITEEGEVLGIERTAEDAAELAMDRRPDNVVEVEEVDETRQNPEPAFRGLPGGGFAQKAFEATGIGLIPPSAAEIDLNAAKDQLKPYFDWLRARHAGSTVKAYNTVSGITKAWIGQNYKTSKEHPETPSKVMGLTLSPHELVYQIASMPGKYGKHFTDRLKRELPARAPGFTFCKGASAECKQSCLMYAGQNAAAVYNTHRKAMQSVCLMREPEAFMRVLVAAIQQHECVAPTEGYKPFVRLNVLSDIPWEMHAEWLFDLFPRIQFYDYTKVPGRFTPANYELTFSFSGQNEQYCRQEMENFARKVAVVFVAMKPKGKGWVAWKKSRGTPIPLPDEFWGVPVIDGDISDVRPLDRYAPGVVALRWKSPSLKKSGLKKDPIKQLEENIKAGPGVKKGREVTFVTPTYVVDGEARLERSNPPWTTPNPDRLQFLITAATPRFEVIDQDVAAAE